MDFNNVDPRIVEYIQKLAHKVEILEDVRYTVDVYLDEITDLLSDLSDAIENFGDELKTSFHEAEAVDDDDYSNIDAMYEAWKSEQHGKELPTENFGSLCF